MSLQFFSFQLRCDPDAQDLNLVRLHTWERTTVRKPSTHHSYSFMFMACTALEFSLTALSQQLCATCYTLGAQDSRDGNFFSLLWSLCKVLILFLDDSTNTLKIVRELILWWISTGMLMLYVLPYFFLWILSQSWNIECRITNAIFLLSVTLLSSKYCLVASQSFSQLGGYIQSGFTMYFITGGSESLHFLFT